MNHIEDEHGVTHVAQPSTDAVHWTRCGIQISDDGHEYLGELHGLMGASLRTVVVPAGRRVDRAPTCLWCAREPRLVGFYAYESVGVAVMSPSSLSEIDFDGLGGLVPNEAEP